MFPNFTNTILQVFFINVTNIDPIFSSSYDFEYITFVIVMHFFMSKKHYAIKNNVFRLISL